VSLNDYEIDWQEWQSRPKPFGISGCIRVRNEAQFMTPSILSHLPYLDECVIVTQPSDDNTVELAKHFAASFKKVKHYHYPFIVDWIDTEGFYSKDPDKPGHLVHMSNWALSKCTYSWISKTEGDVLCLSSYQRIVDAVRANPTRSYYYGRLILNIAGENCDQISIPNPTNGGFDEATFNNMPERYHFIRSQKWEVIPMGQPAECMGLSMLHLKRCKTGKTQGWNGEHYAPFTKETIASLTPHLKEEIDSLWDEIQMQLEDLR
jgi:hypothetical protein